MATSAIGTFDFEGQALNLFNADENHISPVTLLTRKAFERWTEQGLHLNPARQTEEVTKNYLLNRSYVLQNSKDETVGTFSITDGTLENRPSQGFLLKRDSNEVPYQIDSPELLETSVSKWLVFRKLAVAQEYEKKGIAKWLYLNAEKECLRDTSYSGMMLETVKEARWLFEWYLSLGFKTIGSHRYPGVEIDTVLMIKERKYIV